MAPILSQCLYNTACVLVSLEGRKEPFTVLPSKSTITILSGDKSLYGTPLGLIAKTPSALSATLTLPKVKRTRPRAGSCMLASKHSSLIALYLLMTFLNIEQGTRNVEYRILK